MCAFYFTFDLRFACPYHPSTPVGEGRLDPPLVGFVTFPRRINRARVDGFLKRFREQEGANIVLCEKSNFFFCSRMKLNVNSDCVVEKYV